ncbi:MAG: TorF family putative porin [Woeseiaceae bacterium]|nr:TorF family putative porin [Woeseiaceae bacterium]
MHARIVFAVLALGLCASHGTAASEWSGYAVATSDYVFRGVTQSDGHAALQLGIDAAFDSGAFLGAWASTVDIPGPDDVQRSAEARIYAGYGFDINERLRATLAVVAYRYPDSDGPVDYENQEALLSLGIDDTYWFEYAYSPDLYEFGWDTHNIDLFAEWPLGASWSASIGVGYQRLDAQTRHDSFYSQLGLTRTFSQFAVDARLHNAVEAMPFIGGEDRVGTRASISLRWDF